MFQLNDDVLFIISDILGLFETAKLAKLNTTTRERIKLHAYWPAFVSRQKTRAARLSIEEDQEKSGGNYAEVHVKDHMDAYSQAATWIYGNGCRQGSSICACGNYLGLNVDWVYSMECRKYCTTCGRSYVRGPHNGPGKGIDRSLLSNLESGHIALWHAIHSRSLAMAMPLHGNCYKD